LINFTTQINVNSKYNIKNIIMNTFIFSYSIIDIKLELLIFKKMFFFKKNNLNKINEKNKILLLLSKKNFSFIIKVFM